MKYKVTLNGRVYEVEVEAGQAMLLAEYEAIAPWLPLPLPWQPPPPLHPLPLPPLPLPPSPAPARL